MKKLLLGLLVLGSFSTFASSDCDQKLDSLVGFAADHIGVSKEIIRQNNGKISNNNQYISILEKDSSIEFIAGKDLDLLKEENKALRDSSDWSKSVIEESNNILEMHKEAVKQACK
jgi:hypothetical protein